MSSRITALHEILQKQLIGPQVYLMRVMAPEIARKRQAGQFVILRVTEQGERFPLTIVDSDAREGSIIIIFQAIGVSTRRLAALSEGESILDIAGPLGNAIHIEKYGHVVCVGGGVGIAPAYPIAAAMKAAGNRLTALISGRTKEHVILRDEMAAIADEVKIATDDGSLGVKGFPTHVLQAMLDAGEKIDFVLAVGPVPMMRAVAELTRTYGIRTMVSLNPIMVDGTGMCGGCRVEVGGETRFACMDGPEFDGHQVNFDLLSQRLKAYDAEEKQLSRQHDEECRLK
jgi:ferredoxin/flavodoxin---NADP+ reductase